jgi:glycosyltransferase involved in cell wall biosynthesis
MRDRTVVYLQYTNPAVYPPIQHSAGILAEAGWQVVVLGVTVPDVAQLEFPAHQDIEVRLTEAAPPGGWRQKFHYLRFSAWALRWILRQRGWVYASDALTSPVALLASYIPGVRVVYHEHDSPGRRIASRFMKAVLGIRRRLLRRAAMVVAPNAQRARAIAEDAGTPIKLACVWNCPRRIEVAATARHDSAHESWIMYHGSIVPARLPRTLIEALTLVNPCVKLRVIGYETAGHVGYVRELTELAASLGVGQRLEFLPMVPTRDELLTLSDRSEIGLSLMPLRTDDVNERWMSGASNKTFDYMARGVPVLVSDLPEWKATFVDAGFGRACKPDDPQSIADALEWFHEHREDARRMGECGRQRILTDWNYERQFEPVFQLMTATR